MKIVVIGGTGLIGSKVVAHLAEAGHEAIPGSPRLGINTITGQGVAAALAGASAVVDVSNSPSLEYRTALEFFETSTRNLLATARTAGVTHLVALSVVGTETLSRNGDPEATTAGYFLAKLAQERLIADSGLPYSIIHATQFFEFLTGIADGSTVDGAVRLPPAGFQPMAADDVALAVARAAAGAPARGVVEIGGPERLRLDETVRRALAALNDPREVITDPAAGYFGIRVDERTLVPADGATLGTVRLDDWLAQAAARPVGA
jgi:uncharacterized protein YbjT (DUF2867 family)